ARGATTRERVEEMNDRIRRELPVLDVLSCYHDNADDCICRKPKPGLLLEAVRRWRLDPRRSFLVGDRWSDVAGGQAVGCRTLLVATPYSGRQRCVPDHVVGDLAEAAAWIIHHSGEIA